MERAAVPGMIREQKLNQWIEDYSDSILRTCFLYLSDQNQAEDATQDTWIKAWKHMDDYERKSITNDKAWLLRIAINTCKDYRRSAWFRHIDRNKVLDELPSQLIAVEPEDRTLNGGDIDYDLMAIAMHRYGLPRETDITVEQAYQIAVDYLKEHYGLSEDIISHYDQWYYSYDITDPDNPKWCIVFWPGGSSAMYLMNTYGHDQSSSNYRIEINPSNGIVLNDVVIRLPYSRELSWLVNRY